jgi:ergothioneine biosynthesis protein EgtB
MDTATNSFQSDEPVSDHTSDSEMPQNRLQRYKQVRAQSKTLVNGLSDADCTVQSMPDASPAKWHLAHTSWFFEEFVLCGFLGQKERFDRSFSFLFNSYYDAVGDRHLRHARGLLTRPSLNEVLSYRDHVDRRMEAVLAEKSPEKSNSFNVLIDLGFAHEEQHQELLLTDLLHLFSCNPLKPAYAPLVVARPNTELSPLGWTHFEMPGQYRMGHDGNGFAFDCEGPAHDVLLRPFALANRTITNGEWTAFITDGGYETSTLWLSDGWACAQDRGWTAPLYWQKTETGWQSMTLQGLRPVEPTAPVTHISFYEADAFASWAAANLPDCDGARLPREEEWEFAAQDSGVGGNTIQTGALTPLPQNGVTLSGLFGDVWEWTSSPFTPYPGFRPTDGAVGEYNGKFMSGQQVLRGGSCVTPAHHLRHTYRNFFHPDKRWQFSGLRLARDL